MKPIIGIVSTPYLDKDGDKMFCVDYNVYNWIVKSGGTPLTIMPTNIDDIYEKRYRELNYLSGKEIDELVRVLDMCDGIIKPGGTSIQTFHKAIYNYTVIRNMPYLGICNGMQLMVKAYDNDTNLVKTPVNHNISNVNAHYIWISEKSLLRQIVNKRTMLVSSRHNYCVHDLKNLRITATDEFGVIEAVENPICDYNIGLQWHPEVFDFDHEDSVNIFNSFIEASSNHDKQKVYKKTIY